MRKLNIFIRTLAGLTSAAALTLYLVYDKTQGEYIGNVMSVFTSNIVIVLVTLLPNALAKNNIKISKTLYGLILTGILASMGAGVIFRFYEIFDYFDTLVHFFNGGILVISAFTLLMFFVRNSEKHVKKLIFIAVLLSISVGTLWEIYEFLVDLIIPNSNMQRFEDVITGIPHIGQRALYDTMLDLIVDTLGAILAAVILTMDYLQGKKFINKLLFVYDEQLVETKDVTK